MENTKKPDTHPKKARYTYQKSLLYMPIYIQKACYTCRYTSKKLAIHLLYIAPKLTFSRENPLYTKIPLRYTCYTLLYMAVSPPPKKTKTKKNKTANAC